MSHTHFTIRDLIPGDIADLEGNPGWRTPKREPDQAYVAVDDGRIVGAGLLKAFRPDHVRVEVFVPTGDRRRGVGGRLLAYLTEMAVLRRISTLHARVDAGDEATLAFWTWHGFEEYQRVSRCRLTRDVYDTLAFASRIEQLECHGVYLTTLAKERLTNPNYDDLLADLQSVAQPEWSEPDPDPAEFTPVKYRTLHEAITDALNEYDQSCLIAVRNGEYIGYAPGDSQSIIVRPGELEPEVREALLARRVDQSMHDREIMEVIVSGPSALTTYQRLGFVVNETNIRMQREIG